VLADCLYRRDAGKQGRCKPHPEQGSCHARFVTRIGANGHACYDSEPMDRPTHARFLTYLEVWEYFRPPGQPRLDRAGWEPLDAALEALLAEAERRPLGPDEVAELRDLARRLFRD